MHFFKQFPLKIKQNLEFECQLTDGEILLSVVVGVVGFLSEKLVNVHNTTFLVLPSLFKI